MLDVVALAGLNEPVTPAGSPETVKLTAPLKPDCGLIVTLAVPLAPAAIERLGEASDSAKLGALEVPLRLLINA